jgi:hypothetical protein
MLASTMQFSNTNQDHPHHKNHLTPDHDSQRRFGSGECLTRFRSRNNTACCLRTQQCANPTTSKLVVLSLCIAIKEDEQSLQHPSEALAVTAGHPTRGSTVSKQ